MAKLDHLTLMKIHMMLAAFILPAALMFFITGGFYTWGIKGSYETETHKLILAKPLEKDPDALVKIIEKQLRQRQISFPTGEAKLKKAGISYLLEWTGSDHDVILQPTANLLEARLQIKTASWYRHFVQLHKAKGGIAFKVYAAFLAISLLTLLLTGLLMAWQKVKYRNMAITSFSVGVLVFISVFWVS